MSRHACLIRRGRTPRAINVASITAAIAPALTKNKPVITSGAPKPTSTNDNASDASAIASISEARRSVLLPRLRSRRDRRALRRLMAPMSKPMARYPITRSG
jgi:hypothetical protein